MSIQVFEYRDSLVSAASKPHKIVLIPDLVRFFQKNLQKNANFQKRNQRFFNFDIEYDMHLFNNDVYDMEEIDQNENHREKKPSWKFDPAGRLVLCTNKHSFNSSGIYFILRAWFWSWHRSPITDNVFCQS